MLGPDDLAAEAVGDVVASEDGVLLLRRIHVTYKVKGQGDHREAIERVHGVHQAKCPLYRSLEAAIEISTTLELIG